MFKIALHFWEKEILKSILNWRNKQYYLEDNDLCHCKTAWHTPIGAIQQCTDHFWFWSGIAHQLTHPNFSKKKSKLYKKKKKKTLKALDKWVFL